MEKTLIQKEHSKILAAYGLDSDTLENCFYVTYQPGEYVFTEGLVNEFLFIVLSGQAKVHSTTVNGKDLVISYYDANGLMGDMEMMTEAKIASSTVTALSNFSCLIIPYYKNIEKLQSNIVFMNYVAKSLSAKLYNSSHDFVSTTLYTGEQRLCSYILKRATADFFKEKLTDVSATIGLSYRHLFRLLDQLCLDQIIRKSAGGYLILDYDQLQQKSIENS